MIATDGARQPYLRTGYEYIVPNRTNEIFAYNAKEDGKVIHLDDKGITIEYASGDKKGITLGRIFGKAEGSIYPHDIISNLKLGQKFKKGDNIAYNTGFFEQDILDPSRIVLKTSILVKTALYESNQTHEDSSSISKALSEKLTTKTTKVKSIVVNFAQNIINPVKVGKEVHPKDVLLIIEDEITAGSKAFDEASLNVLRKLSNQAPRANYLGVIDKIEVFYHGDKSDMSASLKALADKSDKLMVETCKASNKPVIDGGVNDDYRVGGVPLALDKAEIKIYITITTGAGVGDKVIFASQAKSVIGEVMDYSMTTETGETIGAVFGSRSIYARIINSPFIIGTTTSLLKVIGNKAVELYNK